MFSDHTTCKFTGIFYGCYFRCHKHTAINNLHNSAPKRVVASIAASSTFRLYDMLILTIAKNLKVKQRKNVLIYIKLDATLHSLFYLETVLHVSVGTPIIRSANNCIYSIWDLSHRYCYLPLSWKSWNRFECAVCDVRHPQHIQTTIAADSSNGVTNPRCCRYSCLRS